LLVTLREHRVQVYLAHIEKDGDAFLSEAENICKYFAGLPSARAVSDWRVCVCCHGDLPRQMNVSSGRAGGLSLGFTSIFEALAGCPVSAVYLDACDTVDGETRAMQSLLPAVHKALAYWRYWI
jgi:hypothetical protein